MLAPLYLGARDSNSGPHTYTEKALDYFNYYVLETHCLKTLFCYYEKCYNKHCPFSIAT